MKVTGVELRTPEDWWELPLRPETADADIEAIVDGWVATSPGLAARRDEVVALLDQVAGAARRSGAIFAAQWAVAGPAGATSANVTVALQQIAEGDDPWSGAGAVVDVGDDPLREGRCRVELPDAGTAIRALRRAGPGPGLTATQLDYVVPVPGTDSHVAVMTFTSTDPGPAERSAVELFDSIARSFRFLP